MSVVGTQQKRKGPFSHEQDSQTNLDELREAFEFFDRNGNGSIEADELGAVMDSLGYAATESELQDMIHEADLDGNNKIDFEEFVKMMESKSRHGQAEEEDLREAFKVKNAVTSPLLPCEVAEVI